MRFTEDHIPVAETDHVYEILYRYINPEYSQPEPDLRKVKDIPPGTPIWKEKENCIIAIKKIHI